MGDDLDDILDDALDDLADDFGDESTGDKTSDGVNKDNEDYIGAAARQAAAKSHAAFETSALKAKEEQEKQASEAGAFGGLGDLSNIMKEMQNPDFTKDLEGMLKMMNIDMDGEEGAEARKILEGLSSEESFNETFKKLTETAAGIDGLDPSQTEAGGEKMMEEMLKQFESMGQKEDFQKQIDAMMKQIVSKEVMYDPVKKVCDEYPSWLATNKGKLKEEEYENYGNQFQFFQKIVAVYETEPENLERIIELMQEMQEYGNPPKEIVEKVAPGMDFSNPLSNMMPPGASNQGCPQM